MTLPLTYDTFSWTMVGTLTTQTPTGPVTCRVTLEPDRPLTEQEAEALWFRYMLVMPQMRLRLEKGPDRE